MAVVGIDEPTFILSNFKGCNLSLNMPIVFKATYLNVTELLFNFEKVKNHRFERKKRYFNRYKPPTPLGLAVYPDPDLGNDKMTSKYNSVQCADFTCSLIEALNAWLQLWILIRIRTVFNRFARFGSSLPMWVRIQVLKLHLQVIKIFVLVHHGTKPYQCRRYLLSISWYIKLDVKMHRGIGSSNTSTIFILFNGIMRQFTMPYCRVSDPHQFHADPDPGFLKLMQTRIQGLIFCSDKATKNIFHVIFSNIFPKKTKTVIQKVYVLYFKKVKRISFYTFPQSQHF